jgi:hypothetical protein
VSPSTTRTTEAWNDVAGSGGDCTGPGSMTGGADGAPCEPAATRRRTTTASTSRTAAARRMSDIVAAAAVPFDRGEGSVDG